MTALVGTVEEGYRAAGSNLRRVLPLIEERSGLRSLIPHTLNLKLEEPYLVVPDFIVTREEYNLNNEEILFQRCSVKRLPCLIMRPDSHQRGEFHGPAYLELMSFVWLRERFHLNNGSSVTVEV